MKELLILLFIVPFLLAAVSPFLTKDEIEIQLEKAVVGEFKKKVRVEIASIQLRKRVPKGAALKILNPRPPIGVVSFRYSWKEAKKRKVASGSAVVRVYTHIAVSKAPIRHKELFNQSNILFEEKELSRYSQAGYFTSLEQVAGMQARGSVRPGAVLSHLNTEIAPLVHRGQMANLTYQQRLVKIVARVRVLQDGRTGDWIRVLNPQTHKEIMAQVAGKQELRIE